MSPTVSAPGCRAGVVPILRPRAVREGPCDKCGLTDRYKDGECRGCKRAYYAAHRDEALERSRDPAKRARAYKRRNRGGGILMWPTRVSDSRQIRPPRPGPLLSRPTGVRVDSGRATRLAAYGIIRE